MARMVGDLKIGISYPWQFSSSTGPWNIRKVGRPSGSTRPSLRLVRDLQLLLKVQTNARKAGARKLEEKLRKRTGGKLVGSTTNLVDRIWPDRPPRPNEPVQVLPIEYTGKSVEEKLKDLRKTLDKKKATGMIVCRFSLGYSRIFR